MDLYQHIRVVVSILVGLSVAHLLTGVARLIQHPRREKVFWVHLVWTLYVFLYVITFWWWEFRLEKIPTWTFALYFFVISYGIILFLLCALLFPADVRDYAGFKEYFYLRRQWFFGTMAAMWIVDYIDTIIKGTSRLQPLGIEYDIRVATYVICSLIAMKTKNELYHAAFAVIGVLYEISFILRLYFIVG